jgi:hypothetical protein
VTELYGLTTFGTLFGLWRGRIATHRLPTPSFLRVLARSMVDQGQAHEIDHDEIDYDAAISTVKLAI